MTDEEEFLKQKVLEIEMQKQSLVLQDASKNWMQESIKTNYSYHFEWLGRPIIQYPQDMIAVQQLLWRIQPDLIIETGIARGGSLIFYASILELISQCGGPKDAKILGIDIDIRQHNKRAILAHPMAKRIEMLEGSSIDPKIIGKVTEYSKNKKRVVVCLDSNHTHNHVLEELHLYSDFVSKDSYMIVFDTIVEQLNDNIAKDRPWAKGNNPMTAVEEFLSTSNNINKQFVIDTDIQNTILLTVAPNGYLRRV